MGQGHGSAGERHSKDHHPDLKQLVFILTVTADGAVPVARRVEHGNTEDSSTHVSTWDSLRALLGRSDFLYVADLKLATRKNMDHIASLGGRSFSVLLATRKEDRAIREWLVTQEGNWTEALRRAGCYVDETPSFYETAPVP